METRRQVLRRGIGFCVVPAILFLPTVAALTVCPPTYGIFIMKSLAITFIASAAYGIFRLALLAERAMDFESVVGFLAIAIGLLVIAVCVWGFVAPRP